MVAHEPVPDSFAPNVSDDELIAWIDSGSDSANEGMRLLQQRYGKRIYHFVRGLLRDAHLAQDVTQEVFEKVLVKSHLYQPGTNFRAWLFEVARNQALSTLRSRRRSPRPISSLVGPGDDEPDLLDATPDWTDNRGLEEQEFMRAFAQAVAELPERYQTVFNLCVREGRPYQDAARLLDLPTGTVAIRIMRARKRLFQALSRHIDRLRRPPACFQ